MVKNTKKDNEKTKKLTKEQKEQIEKDEKNDAMRRQARAEFEQRKKEHKEGKDKPDYMREIATRNVIEGDSITNTINVSFDTADGVKRTIVAKKPSNSQFVKILSFPMIARGLQSVGSDINDEEAIGKAERAVNLYASFSKLAADLTVDTTLDEKFWGDSVPDTFLQSFMAGYIEALSSGVVIPKEEMEKFRSN